MRVYQNKEKVFINVYVVPRSSKAEIAGIYDDCLKIKLKSAPLDNKANEELIIFLAEKLKVPKKNIEIFKGHTQRKKVVSVTGCNIKLINNLTGL